MYVYTLFPRRLLDVATRRARSQTLFSSVSMTAQPRIDFTVPMHLVGPNCFCENNDNTNDQPGWSFRCHSPHAYPRQPEENMLSCALLNQELSRLSFSGRGASIYRRYRMPTMCFLGVPFFRSARALLTQYFRCYSPVAFGKKTDKNGDFIRKYIPVLRHFPSQYIYEPWKAPLQVRHELP